MRLRWYPFSMLNTQQVEKFKRDGFLNGGNVLDEATVQELSDALDAVIAIGPNGFADGDAKPVLYRSLTPEGEEPVWQIVNIWEASDPFARLMRHPAIIEAMVQLTGFTDLQVWHDQVQFKPANHGGATPWHQDAPLWPSIEPMTPVSAWVPFDDASEDNGCMWMVPGSHKWGNQVQYFPSQNQLQTLPDFKNVGKDFKTPDGSEVVAVPCPVKRGEVHYHHSLTWHGSPRNHSPRPRRAVAIHYMTSEAVYTGREHTMAQYISISVGEPMIGAGSHFPIVCRDGKPVEASVS